MNLKLFPLDTQVAENPWLDVKMGANDGNCRFNFYFSSFQTCHLTIASYGWTASDLIYLWKVKTLTKHKTNIYPNKTKNTYLPFPISRKGWKSFLAFSLTECIYFRCSTRAQSSLCQTFTCLADSSSLNTLIARCICICIHICIYKKCVFLTLSKIPKYHQKYLKKFHLSPAL